MTPAKMQYVRFFEEIGIDDVPLVGGKNPSLGEMYRNLASEGVRVPNGFAVTARAYRYVLDSANGWGALHEALDRLRPDDMEEILEGYRRLRAEYGEAPSLAVRSYQRGRGSLAGPNPATEVAHRLDAYPAVLGAAHHAAYPGITERRG